MVRILTYNVHRCLGTDGKLSPDRIASVIESCRADIVALQELDVRRQRSGLVDQALEIATALGMHGLHFHPALRVMEEEYGDAILTAHPSRLVKAGPLPGLPSRPTIEPRGALWVAVEIDGVELQVVNTHLGLWGAERAAQADCLLGPDWLGHPDCRSPRVLVGDLNAVPRSRAYRRLAGRLCDAGLGRSRGAGATFPSRLPLLRIDHVFVDETVEVVRARPVRTPLSRIASDHLPLLVELDLSRAGGPKDRNAAPLVTPSGEEPER